MDINQNKLTNHAWDVDTANIEDQILHDPIACFNSLWPIYSYPLQAQQIPSSSSNQIPSATVIYGDKVGQNMEEEEQEEEEPEEELGAMKEMMYRIAAMQPVDIDPATVQKPKRRNIRISDDPQSVAARHRRERISEKIRILQRLVPGGTKMDTASMLDEAIRYVKFLKRQIRLLQSNQNPPPPPTPLPCITNWQHTVPNKTTITLGSTSNSVSLDHHHQGLTTTFGSTGGRINNNLCFNHEVISD